MCGAVFLDDGMRKEILKSECHRARSPDSSGLDQTPHASTGFAGSTFSPYIADRRHHLTRNGP